jgi:hypothetical protein
MSTVVSGQNQYVSSEQSVYGVGHEVSSLEGCRDRACLGGGVRGVFSVESLMPPFRPSGTAPNMARVRQGRLSALVLVRQRLLSIRPCQQAGG